MMSSDVGPAISRLYEDESLTADVDDAAAKALLRWGEERLKQGAAEDAVRQGLRALVQVIAGRDSLAPAEARARLEQGGFAADEATLAGLWTEPPGAAEWAERLVRAVQALSSAPLPPFPAPECGSEEGGRPEGRGKEERASIPWWQRLLSPRRHRP
jgi:hypothetical protein